METPRGLLTVGEGETPVRTYEYDDESVVVADFGDASEDASVDVVGDTAIVVVGDEQVEFRIPAEADEVSIDGGVLLVESE